MKQFAWFNFRRLLVFALAGPPLGLLFSGIINVGGWVPGADPVEVLAWARVMVILLVWAYLFGLVPATLTGLAVLALLQWSPAPLRDRLWMQLLTAFLVGALLTGLLFFALPFNAVYFAFVGGCSAAGCALLAGLLKVGTRPGQSESYSRSN
jgi:hypothetical protein